MKKKILALLTVFSLLNDATAQQEITGKASKGKNNEIAIGLCIPAGGYLKDISNFGIGLSYSRSRGRWGILTSLPDKFIGLTFNTGIARYFGQKENMYNQTVKYKGITYLYGFAGVVLNPLPRCNIRLTGGPCLEVYNGNYSPGLGINLSGSLYHIRNGNISLTPRLTLYKLKKSEAVLSFSVSFDRVF